MPNLDQKKNTIQTVATWIIALVALALAGPFIFLAFKGLVALIAFVVVCLVTISAAPVVGMKIANWKIKEIKAEAAANPIETMESTRIERAAQLERGREGWKKTISAVRMFEDTIRNESKDLKVDDPQMVKFKEDLNLMKQAERNFKLKIERAEAELGKFDRTIERAKAIWRIALAGQQAGNAIKMSSGDIYEKIKIDTAFESVESAMAETFAELEVTMNENMGNLSSVAESPATEFVPAAKTLGARTRE